MSMLTLFVCRSCSQIYSKAALSDFSNNAGDLKNGKAINASLFHCVATASTPHTHVHCPDGKESWGHFKKYATETTNTY